MIREAVATARSQPVGSIVTIVMIAGMCATVLLTTGRTVGAEQAVLGSIDSAGTRSIIVRAESDAGLDTSILGRLEHVDGIQWLGAFSAARDVTNALIPDGSKVPIRYIYTADLGQLSIPPVSPVTNGTAWGSAKALEQLGMPDRSGGVSSEGGLSFALAGQLAEPEYLTFLEPILVVPSDADAISPVPVSVVVVIASSPELVSPVAKTVQSLLAVDDPTKVSFTTSESLAKLRALVQGQLGSFGRSLVIAIFAVTATLVAAILYGLVMMRRKDFGRRRALGATQRLIIALLVTQTTILSCVGALLGCAAAAISLVAARDPLPGIDFFVAVSILAVAVGLLSSMLPAIAAARREPIKELRVP